MPPRRLSWLLNRQDEGSGKSRRQRAFSAASEKMAVRSPVAINGSMRTPVNEKQPGDSPDAPRGPSMSMSISTIGGNTEAVATEDVASDNGPAMAKRIIRTVPAWVRDADEDDLIWHQAFESVSTPGATTVAQHNHTPSTRPYARSTEPHLPGEMQQHTSRWVTFAKASAYPREHDECENVSVEWLNQNFGDYSTPWLAGLDAETGEDDSSRYHAFRRKRRVWHKRVQAKILRHPFVPLFFRFIVFLFSAIGLSLGAAIYAVKKTGDGPSAEMAIVVDVVAMFYTVYITVDEYISKPLGLRSIKAKLRLIFLDLYFIVFEAANLTLAMEGIGHGQGCGPNDTVWTCHRQKALAAVLNIALVAWLLTFAVSVLRLVERAVQG